MKPGTSIDYQAKIAYNYVNGIGSSKRSSRKESNHKGENGHNVSEYIHSFKGKDQFIRLTKDILKHQKSMGERPDLHTLTKDVLSSYINDKIERGLKYDTLSTYLSQFNKLSIAINKIPDKAPQHIKDIREPIFDKQDVKEIRTIAKEQALTSSHTNRAYTNPDAIRTHLSDKAVISFKLQTQYGLRVTAATKISPNQLKGNNSFEFVNKGGKLQTIRIEPQLYKDIEHSIKNNDGKGHHITYNKYMKEFKNAVSLSGQKYQGTHGLRYSYAQSKMQDLRDKGYSDLEAKQIISNDLGHERTSITEHYLCTT